MPQHQLYGLRGRAYVAKYKQLYADLKDQIADDVHRIKVENGKFTIYDFGSLCMKYRLPTTAMDDFLIVSLPFRLGRLGRGSEYGIEIKSRLKISE